MHDVIRENLTDLINAFVEQTNNMREFWEEDAKAPSYREPTFQEFIDWLN